MLPLAKFLGRQKIHSWHQLLLSPWLLSQVHMCPVQTAHLCQSVIEPYKNFISFHLIPSCSIYKVKVSLPGSVLIPAVSILHNTGWMSFFLFSIAFLRNQIWHRISVLRAWNYSFNGLSCVCRRVWFRPPERLQDLRWSIMPFVSWAPSHPLQFILYLRALQAIFLRFWLHPSFPISHRACWAAASSSLHGNFRGKHIVIEQSVQQGAQNQKFKSWAQQSSGFYLGRFACKTTQDRNSFNSRCLLCGLVDR